MKQLTTLLSVLIGLGVVQATLLPTQREMLNGMRSELVIAPLEVVSEKAADAHRASLRSAMPSGQASSGLSGVAAEVDHTAIGSTAVDPVVSGAPSAIPADPDARWLRRLLRALSHQLGFTTSLNRSLSTASNELDTPLPTVFAVLEAATVTDPVIPTSGEMTYDYKIVAAPGVGLDFAIVASYRSGYNYNGPLGQNWDHNWNARFKDNGTTLTRHAGNRNDIYTNPVTTSGVTSYTSPAGFYEKSVTKHTPSGGVATITRTLQDGTKEIYELSSYDTDWYALKRVEARDTDNFISLAYETASPYRLSVITDTRGTTFEFIYDSVSRIAEIKEQPVSGTARNWLFGYGTTGSLVTLDSITGPDTDAGAGVVRRTTEFDYSSISTLALLTSVKAPREVATSGPAYLQMTYVSGTAKVETQIFGTSSQQFSITYAAGKTTEVDRTGTSYEYEFTGSGASLRLNRHTVKKASQPDITTNFYWTSDGLLHFVQKPEGNGVLYSYTNGRLTHTSEFTKTAADAYLLPSIGTPPSVSTMRSSTNYRVTEYVYESTADWTLLEKVIDPMGSTWELDRDALGNVTHYRTPLHPTHPWVITYDSQSRATTTVDPEGRETVYAYCTSNGGRKGLLEDVQIELPGSPSEVIRTSYVRDDYGNITAIHRWIDGEVFFAWSFVRNAIGLVTMAATPMDEDVPDIAFETHYAYDLNDVVTRITSPTGSVSMGSADYKVDYEYNLLDLVTKVKEFGTGSSSRDTIYTYDLEDRLVTTQSPGERKTASVYDYRGLLVTAITAAGASSGESAVTYAYDKNGRLTRTRQADSSNATTFSIDYVYDGFDRLVTTTDGEGHFSVTIYDKNSNATCRYNGSNGSYVDYPFVFAGDGTLGTPSIVSNKHVYKTHFVYDVNNQLVSKQLIARKADAVTPLSGSTELLLVSTYIYDKTGLLTTLVEPCGCGGSTGAIMAYDLAGRLTKRTDGEGNESIFSLDLLGRTTLVEQREVDGPSAVSYFAAYTYDKNNRLVTQRSQKSSSANADEDPFTVITYDHQDRVVLVATVPVSGTSISETRFEHDQYGQVTKKLLSVTATANIEQRFAYDNDGLTTSVTAVRAGTPSNGVTTYSYDAAGRLTSDTDESSESELYSYDVNGRLVTLTKRNGNSTVFEYDKRGLVTKKEHLALSGSTAIVGPTLETYGYDALGRNTYALNADALVLREWNTINKLEREIQYVRKHFADPVTLVGANANRRDILYSYDTSGRLSETTYHDGLTKIRPSYDGLNQITRVEKQYNGGAWTEVAEWTMQGPGRALTLELGNGVKETMTYDGYGRLTRLKWDRPVTGGRATMFDYLRAYDRASRPVYEQREFFASGDTTAPTKLVGDQDFGDAYQYDRANRLTKVIRGVGRTTLDSTVMSSLAEPDPSDLGYPAALESHIDTDFVRRATYSLDETGNRKTLDFHTIQSSAIAPERSDVGSFTADNQLTTLVSTDQTTTPPSSLGSTTYDWNDNGAMTAIMPPSPAPAQTFGLDVYDRIYTFGAFTYRYDALGRRVEKRFVETTNSGIGSWSRTFFYDGIRCVQEFEERIESASGSPVTRQYDIPSWTRIYGPFLIDQILWGHRQEVEFNTSTNSAWVTLSEDMYFALDFLGSVVTLTSSASIPSILEQLRYTEYGETTWFDGSGALRSSGTNHEQYKCFTGRRWDAENGLTQYRARVMLSPEGVFIARDPILSDRPMSPYWYVRALPIAGIDPLGLQGDFWGRIGNGLGVVSDEQLEQARALANAAGGGVTVDGILATGQTADSLSRSWSEIIVQGAGLLPGKPEDRAHNKHYNGTLNGARNALRHCIWACELTGKFGRDPAGRVLDANETLPVILGRHQNPRGSPGGTATDRDKDEHNNAQGQHCATFTHQSCLECCNAKLVGGFLWWSSNIKNAGGATGGPSGGAGPTGGIGGGAAGGGTTPKKSEHPWGPYPGGLESPVLLPGIKVALTNYYDLEKLVKDIANNYLRRKGIWG